MKLKSVEFSLACMLLTSCSSLNLLKGQHDFCRSMLAGVPDNLQEHVEREIGKELPNGALTKPYSRAVWNDYWNSRIYYVRRIDADSCGGTYRGPTGEKMIADALAARRKAGLAEVVLEERNQLQDASQSSE